jgi:hypothetical protein
MGCYYSSPFCPAIRIADLQSAERSQSNGCGSLLAQCRMEFCDTAQCGEAATEGARRSRRFDIRRPRMPMTQPGSTEVRKVNQPERRAPENCRGLRQFLQILID